MSSSKTANQILREKRAATAGKKPLSEGEKKVNSQLRRLGVEYSEDMGYLDLSGFFRKVKAIMAKGYPGETVYYDDVSMDPEKGHLTMEVELG